MKTKKNVNTIKTLNCNVIYMCNLHMVLRRIFGPRRDEVTGEWRRLHNEELNDLYSYPILCG